MGSVSLSLLPATSRVYFSFLFSSPRLSFSLLGAFSSSHFSFSFHHSHHLMTSQGHLSAIMEPILLPLFSISSHLRGIFRLSCNYFSRPLIREQERVWRKWRAREKMIFWVILNPFLHNN